MALLIAATAFRALDELMDAQFWALVFAASGFCLLVAEFFVPSGGMIALTCTGSFIASVVCAHSAWYQSSPKIFWSFTLGLVLLVPSFLAFFLRILERTSLGDNLLLRETDLKEVTPYQEETALLNRLVGRVGTTVTPMNPGGMVCVENERLHAISEGFMLQLGDPVEVIGIRGNRVVVKRANLAIAPTESTLTSTGTEQSSLPAAEKPSEPERLDFDVPQD